MLVNFVRTLKKDYPKFFDEMVFVMEPYKNIIENFLAFFGADPKIIEKLKKTDGK